MATNNKQQQQQLTKNAGTRNLHVVMPNKNEATRKMTTNNNNYYYKRMQDKMITDHVFWSETKQLHLLLKSPIGPLI